MTSSTDQPFLILGFGPQATLAPLAAIARDCGFSGAFVRGQREGDVPPSFPSAPAICFTQIAGRTL